MPRSSSPSTQRWRHKPEEFIRGLLRDTGRVRSLSVGEGFQFDAAAAGTSNSFAVLARNSNFRFMRFHPCPSGRSRQQLPHPSMHSGRLFLNPPASCWAAPRRLRKGHGRQSTGRTPGFPTANLDISGLELPPNGVYAVWVQRIAQEQEYPAVLNLGTRPTVTQDREELLSRSTFWTSRATFMAKNWKWRSSA